MNKITLIIPTYNAGGSFIDLLDNINKQSITFTDKIVIDSSSKDNTVLFAKEKGYKTIVIESKYFDHGGTRMLATENIDSDIVIFCTQDIKIYDPKTFEKLILPFEDPNVVISFGRQLPHDNATYFAKQLRENNYSATSYVIDINDKKDYGFKTFFCSNSFAAYRFEALKEIGGFKNNLLFGEDAYATAKLLLKGYKKAYVAEACVKHSHNYTILDEFRRYFDVGVFHTTENWMIDEFGTPTGEGIKYVKNELKFLFKQGKILLCFESIFRNGAKFIGYKLGKSYTFLPNWIITKLTMNKKWWIKQNK